MTRFPIRKAGPAALAVAAILMPLAPPAIALETAYAARPPMAVQTASESLPLARPAAAEAMHLAQTDKAAVDAPTRRPVSALRPLWRWGVESVLVEAGALPDAPEADHQFWLRASPYALWQPARGWEIRVGSQIDASAQGGGPEGFDRIRARLGESYLRYRQGGTRLTLGAQTVVWGRVDEMPLIDRVSRADLNRFVLDDLPDRRLPLPALRWEQTLGDFKVDAVALLGFRGAALPDARSVWSPVDTATGEVLGLPGDPAREAFVRAARLRQDDPRTGGAAARLTWTGEGLDLGLTLARTRQSLPYYLPDLASGTLTATHPYVRFAAADAELATAAVTWRTELAWSDGLPVTAAAGGMLRRSAVEWVGAMEFFPGGEDTRVNLQLAARRIRGGQPVLERRAYTAVNGEVETAFGHGRWKVALRFNLGLNVHDVYLAPRLSYAGWEPHELYVTAHAFDGSERTLGGFHRRHDLLAVGLKTRF